MEKRASWLLWGSVVALSLVSGCAHPSFASWSTARWSSAPRPGLVVIENEKANPTCTGAVVESGAGRTLVLTARHCLVDDEPGSKPTKTFVVDVPVATASGWSWRAMTSKVVAYPTRPTYSVASGAIVGPEVRWIDVDWALLAIDGAPELDVMPLYEGDPRAIPEGAPVELDTFFDDGSAMYPHAHAFAWGDASLSLFRGGHSGAPILYQGKIVAVFRGGRVDWPLWFRAFAYIDLLDVSSVVPVRYAIAHLDDI